MTSRNDLVLRLQSLSQRVATDDAFTLQSAADLLEALSCELKNYLSGAGAAEAGDGAAAASRPAQDAAPDAGAAVVDASKDKDDATDRDAVSQPSKKQRRAPREFDFSRYRTRYVALELLYVGWAFQGFARQDNTENTIEGALFSALRKVKLIPEAAVTPISELQYSRCGRTDRGVSALGQVVALRLRSSARVDEPEAPLDREYDYPRLINKALPTEIRILGWAAVPEDFNARFSAQYREYKYFIVQQRQQRVGPTPLPLPADGSADSAPLAEAAPSASVPAAAVDGRAGFSGADGTDEAHRTVASEMAAEEEEAAGSVPPAPGSGGATAAATATVVAAAAAAAAAAATSCSYALDIGAMREAAARFVGEHDFRNFCKADVTAVRSFRRRILSFTIEPVSTSAGDRAQGQGQDSGQDQGAHQVYAMTVRGTAFLWHQVRCMAAVLLMVGRRQERPDVVSALLDVEGTPRKPQYSMAPEEPLLLYACGFTDLVFRRSPAAVEANLGDVAGLLHRHLIGAALTEACHARLAGDERCADPSASGRGDGGGGRPGGPSSASASAHIPLLRRQTEPSIEERMARRGIPWPPEPAADGGGAAAGGGDEGDPMVE